MNHATNQAISIRNVADRLRGPFRQSQYGRINLAFTVLRQLKYVIEPTHEAVLARCCESEAQGHGLNALLPHVAAVPFYNVRQTNDTAWVRYTCRAVVGLATTAVVAQDPRAFADEAVIGAESPARWRRSTCSDR